jgi:hypothetical protein
VLVGNLVRHLGHARLPGGLSSSSITPAILDKLPPAVHHGLIAGYAESIQTVFVIAAPIALLAFGASLLIPQLELRRGVGPAPDSATGVPTPPADLASPEPLLPSPSNRAAPIELA